MTKTNHYLLKMLVALVALAALTALTIAAGADSAEAKKKTKKPVKFAENASKLDGKDSTEFLSKADSTEFLGKTEKAADSELLDGKDSTEFLGKTEKAADSDLLDGKDFSSSFFAEEVINDVGPVPTDQLYNSNGGTLVISASGSGYRSSVNSKMDGKIGMDIKVNGVNQGFAEVFTNERDSHKAFVTDTVVVKGLPAGAHEIKLEPRYDFTACNKANETRNTYCTTADDGDNFHATVMELPAN